VQAKVGNVAIDRSIFHRIGANCCTGPGATGDVAAAFAGGTMTVTGTSVSEIGSGIPGRATGLLSNGAMTVTGSTVDTVANGGFGPSAGIRSSSGDVTLVDSEVSNIFGIGDPLFGVTADEGHVELVRSRVHDVGMNGGIGGGLDAGDGVTLTDSSIVGINAPTFASLPALVAVLGVRSSGSAPVVLTRSTVGDVHRGDSGSGAGILTAGDVLATNSTLTTIDGPGIITPGDVQLVFSDVVDSGGPSPGGGVLPGAPEGFAQIIASTLHPSASVIALPRTFTTNCDVRNVTSAGDNFTDDSSCRLTGMGDQQTPGVDAQLSALADNGGPTPTRLPAITSPLVGAVAVQTCAAALQGGIVTDQRGLPRRFGGECDIGAVELQTEPTVHDVADPAPPIPQPPRFTG
jgi:hypothetical protein